MFKSVASEFLGTLLLLTTVVGSGIMAETLSGGNIAVALLANALATGAMLFVLINIFGSLSGVHFNPVVTFAMVATGRTSGQNLVPFVMAQIAGAMLALAISEKLFGKAA